MSETAAQRLAASLNPAAQKVRGLLSVVRGAFARLPTFVILYLVCALVPTTLSGVYWGLIASDVYVAEARFEMARVVAVDRHTDQGPVGAGHRIARIESIHRPSHARARAGT